jgi:hypothetical protein
MPTHDSTEFDMWRNMMREYSEEFLGNPSTTVTATPSTTPTKPFRSLDAARNAGKIRVDCLGIGLDALNFVGDVLTVAVFDADVFDEIFDGLVESNDEGIITGNGPNSEQFTLDGPTINRLLSTEAMAQAAQPASP